MCKLIASDVCYGYEENLRNRSGIIDAQAVVAVARVLSTIVKALHGDDHISCVCAVGPMRELSEDVCKVAGSRGVSLVQALAQLLGLESLCICRKRS